MTLDASTASLIAMISVTAILAGAGLDLTFKQFPARYRIGANAYAEYMRAADLKNGVPWYAGMAALVLASTVCSLVFGFRDDPGTQATVALALIAFFTVWWIVGTVIAKPNFESVKTAGVDEDKLMAMISRTAHVHAVRMLGQLAVVGLGGWALAAFLTGSLTTRLRPGGGSIAM
jgi:hypothetical protein